MNNTWIQTYTGKRVDLSKPTSDDISITDIAHSLSLLNRFTGHTRLPISVAQHSIMVANYMPKGDKLVGLLHDAHEAYIGDISSPAANLITKLSREAGVILYIKTQIQNKIYKVFGVRPECINYSLINYWDIRVRLAEARDFLGDIEGWESILSPADDHIYLMSPEHAENKFLNLFSEYIKEVTVL